MKNLILLLIFTTAITNAQIVNIPDANFKAKLLSMSNPIDTNNDGEIQESEALAVTSLDITNSGISNLTGIDFFINLQDLDCGGNQIIDLNITGLINLHFFKCKNSSVLNSINASGLTHLTSFDVLNNPVLTSINLSNCTSLPALGVNDMSNLTAIMVSGCTAITQLQLSNNHLTSFDASGLVNLGSLSIHHNNLTSLNVDGCLNLVVIDCHNNQLSTLSLSNMPSLTQLQANNNALISFNFSGLPNLNIFWCDMNPLPIIDISNLPSLTQLHLGSTVPIQWLNIKNGVHTYLYPSPPDQPLYYACVDESELTASTWSMFNVLQSVNSYCSFTPGGNYNTLNGTITFDENNNGCDAGDVVLSGIKLSLNDGTAVPKTTYTNPNGNYLFYTLTGNLSLTPTTSENSSWFTFSPATVTSPLTTLNNVVTQNFCATANGIHPDLEIVVAPLAIARPGYDASYKVLCRNKGNQTLSGSVNFAFDDSVLDYVSASVSPDSQSAGNLNWNFSNLLPFETRNIDVVLNVNSPTETPPIHNGDHLNFNVSINPIVNDETPLDNVFGLDQIVVGSFDPNNKICLEGNVVSPSKIGDYLHYNINFENTGTFQAENIVVKDMIDTAKFDITTLQIMNSSHPMTTRITGNKVEFIFENINLAAAEHGNVAFKIKTKSTLVAGNTVTNNANIYFDYNAPVLTNTASTTFQALSSVEFTADTSVAIYPNPAKNNVNVTCDSAIKSIQLFDVQGRILETQLINQTHADFDVSKYSKGVYFVKVITEKGIKAQKVVKD